MSGVSGFVFLAMFTSSVVLVHSASYGHILPQSSSQTFTDRVFIEAIYWQPATQVGASRDNGWSVPVCYNSLCCKPPCNIISSCTGFSSSKCDSVAEKTCGSNNHCLGAASAPCPVCSVLRHQDSMSA